MSRVSSVARDLRALGSSAPLRAAYEASKRSNFHAVLFNSGRATSNHVSVPLALGTQIPAGPKTRARCLADAALIAEEGVRVFGRRVSTGVKAPWSTDPLTSMTWPSEPSWWRIDIRTDERLSDVKFVWEAARHRDLVVLARATALEAEGPWLGLLEDMLQRWCLECPPEHGVNWYSSLELALRAIAWSQVLGLVGDRLPASLRRDLDHQLVASARHIMLELPYTVSSMKNNHMLGDGLGLVVLGRLFPTHPASRRWQRVGDRLVLKQLARHMRSDGSMIEDSLSYHRFVLEMLIVRVLVGDAPVEVRLALRGAAEHLRRLGALEGPVPQFGDWDEGRVLSDSADAGSVAGSAWAGLALSCLDVPAEHWDAFDELAWYCPTPTPSAGATGLAPLEAVRRAGDWIVAEHGDWTTWFKVGSGPSHQHADVTSVFVRRGTEWIIRDPGTGTYNGPLHVRNGFRTSVAHPVWVPAGEDQLVPHRAFRWLRSVSAHAVAPARVGDLTVLACWHDAFEATHGCRVARVAILCPGGVTVIDAVEPCTEQTWTLTVPLGSADAAGHVDGLPVPSPMSGQDHPFRGWHSETYGTWTPATWLCSESTLQAPLVWSIGETRAEVSGDELLVEGCAVRLSWDTAGLTVVLRREGSDAEEVVVTRV